MLTHFFRAHNEHEAWWYKIKITPNYGPRYNKMFEQVFIDVAKQSNIKLIPFFSHRGYVFCTKKTL